MFIVNQDGTTIYNCDNIKEITVKHLNIRYSDGSTKEENFILINDECTIGTYGSYDEACWAFDMLKTNLFGNHNWYQMPKSELLIKKSSASNKKNTSLIWHPCSEYPKNFVDVLVKWQDMRTGCDGDIFFFEGYIDDDVWKSCVNEDPDLQPIEWCYIPEEWKRV